MTHEISFRRLMRIASVLMAVAVLGLVLSPVAAQAHTDDETVPSQFRYENGNDNGRAGGGDDGADDGGLNADPNDWDVDSWDGGTVEPAPAPKDTQRLSLLDRWLGWMRSLIEALSAGRSPGR